MAPHSVVNMLAQCYHLLWKLNKNFFPKNTLHKYSCVMCKIHRGYCSQLHGEVNNYVVFFKDHRSFHFDMDVVGRVL